MRRIVVGVDESDGAAEALRWAVAEADLDGAEVTGVLAWDWLDQHHRLGDLFDPSFGEKEAREAVAAFVESVLGANGASRVVTRAVCNLPAPALLEASAHADLLVVGARSTGGFAGLLLGSVAEQCLHHSPIPIAIIRPGSAQAAGPARIVAAVDGSDAARHALQWAAEEALRKSATLDVVNTWEVPAVGYTPYGHLIIKPAHYEDESNQILRDAIASVDTCGVPVTPIALRRVTVQGILDAAAGADLLVIGTRGRGVFARTLLGSVATQVSHHAPCPLVVVPPAASGS